MNDMVEICNSGSLHCVWTCQ